MLVGMILLHTYSFAQQKSHPNIQELPKTLTVSAGKGFHVQGIAFDLKNGYAYFSFTTSLLKTDLKGNILGSVEGFTGHLGCISLNPEDGKLYGSLEYKNDVIGNSIKEKLNIRSDKNTQTGFYIAIFDPEKITRKGMQANENEVMTSVYIKEAVDDHLAKTTNQGVPLQHKYACSGIDGITFGPDMKTKKQMLYIAYGVYGDSTRTDNDYQVLLCYDTSKWGRYQKPLIANSLHQSGPKRPTHKYFIYTGSTNYGIQNMTYDPYTNSFFLAVYKGKKRQFPNFPLFMVEANQNPMSQKLKGFDTTEKKQTLSLAHKGCYDEKSDTWGWNFNLGSTGMAAIGDGYFYFSKSWKKNKKIEMCTIQLYKWNNGNLKEPFTLIKNE